MLKKCSKCKIEKDAKNFYPSKLNKDGLYSYCKKCKKEYQNKKYKKKTIKLTSKEKMLEMIKGGITLKDMVKMFDKKELFRDLQDLIDARIIGSTISINDGQTYYIKNL